MATRTRIAKHAVHIARLAPGWRVDDAATLGLEDGLQYRGKLFGYFVGPDDLQLQVSARQFAPDEGRIAQAEGRDDILAHLRRGRRGQSQLLDWPKIG